MDAPKCPICLKRHYGLCANLTPTEATARDGAEQPDSTKKKSKVARKPGDTVPVRYEIRIEELLARMESLEARVEELESRKRYMREYQARKRAEEGRK